MIPQILELKNFLSYGEQLQRVDFKDYSLICLSGKNGHGKSALLDAITWALWGQARKITGAAKADEGLLRLGQTGMMVSLEFLFAGRTYRVRREYSKPYGKPYAALDFEIFDDTNNKFISLTDKTIRTTQAKIERLIGLDYETFINSAFIRQGQSNEFSKKSSKERKHILANILGLSKYDGLQQQALDKTKNLSDTKKGILTLQEQFLKDLSNEPQLSIKLGNDKEQLAILSKQLESLQKKLKAQEKELAASQTTKNKLSTLRDELMAQEKQYDEGIKLLINRLQEWKKVHAFSLSRPSMHALQEERLLLKNEEKQLLDLQQKNIALHEKILHTKDSLQKHHTLLKNELDQSINKKRLLVQQYELAYQHHQTLSNHKVQHHKDLLSKIVGMQSEQTILEKQYSQQYLFEQQFTFTKNQFEKRRTFYQTLVQRGNWTKNELAELAHKQKTIHDNNNPACPLCEQLLTIKRKQFLAAQLSTHESVLRNRLHRIGIIIKKLKDLLVQQHEQVQLLDKQSEHYKQAGLAILELGKKIKAYEQEIVITGKELEELTNEEKLLTQNLIAAQKELEKQVSSQEHVLQADQELKNIGQLLHDLEQEKKLLTFDPKLYQNLQEKITDLDGLIIQLNNLQHATLLQQERKLSIKAQCKDLKKLKTTIASNFKQLENYSAIELCEQQLLQAISLTNQETADNITQKEQLLHSIGSLEYECKRLEKIKEALQLKNEQLKKLDLEIDDYQIIATALSKNGIQALLIEEAIPEIEQEANAILARLTDNQAQIFIESLRDLKSGGVKETLDIQIADTSGIRPYEMYSGGEAFRVDFALRIAIAKLLARRAGTALQTLIIDEGFGSQDEEGLANIMDSLYAVQDDFSKIIIVSHLPDFKHNFPVHFVIEKSSTGSTVRIEERG